MKTLKKIFKPFSDIVFPVTCVCCGSSTSLSGKNICNWCKNDRFESVNVSNENLLPQKIKFLYSMWHFDKGGYLQKLLHDLKYHYLMGVGEELGFILGRQFLDRADRELKEYIRNSQPILVPVPLHKKKRRKRGYNQARALARGVGLAANWELADLNLITREKSTKTQTGLSTVERAKNLKGAFALNDREKLAGRFPIIVDDVYTTGATTFELADTMIDGEDGVAGIITVAKA